MSRDQLLQKAIVHVDSLKRLQAIGFAEMAMMAPDPERRLEEILGRIEGLAMAVREGSDIEDSTRMWLLQERDEFFESVAVYARAALRATIAARGR